MGRNSSLWLRAELRSRHRHLRVELLEGRRLLAVMEAISREAARSPIAIDRGEHRPATLLVQFRPDASAADQAAAMIPGAKLDSPWAIAPEWRRIELDADTSVEQALAAYKANPQVLYVEPDYRVTLNLIPNDTRFSEQWSLNNTGQTAGTPDADIDAAEAWDVTTGNAAVVVAVIDTGVDYTHPDLADNIWTNSDEIPGNNIDDDVNGYVDDIHGYNFVSGNGDPLDDHFHGTHVAGTIGAIGNNNLGVAGVTWNVQIMALKFLDAGGGGYISDAISALNYAVANGAQISNNSWGGGEYSQAFVQALQNAANAGHIFVAAAGNDSNDNDAFPAYPASYDVENVIAVAATDHNDELAWFSNYGAATVELGAPGDNILSTFPTYLTDAMLSYGLPIDYGAISGTSMATPHVSGALALIRGQHLGWSYDQAIGQLLATTDDTSGLFGLTANGRLNAAASVGNPVPDSSGPRVVASSPSGGITGPVSSVRLRFSEAIDPASFDIDDVPEFTGPGGTLEVEVVAPVPGTNNRQFDVTFAAQSAEGSYSLLIGPHITDGAANEMNQDNDGDNGEPADDQYRATFSIVDTIVVHSTDVPAPIYDLTAVGSYLIVPSDVTIADLNVQLNITHTYDSDLAIYLISPSGNYTFLSYFYGGSGDNFLDTIFDDEAATPIWAGSAPFAGSYQPDTPLSVFDGENAAGLWQLWIEDWEFFDEGWLNAWSIEITPGGGSPPPPPPPTNQPPYAEYDYFETPEGTALVLAAADLLGNDFDPDGDAFSLVGVGDANGGIVEFDGVDTVTFTPDPDFSGNANFTYLIEDARGASAEGYVDVYVLPHNDPPVAGDDFVLATRDTPLVFEGWEPGSPSLLANDTDPDGDWLSLAGVVPGSSSHGTATFDEWTGTITFVPESGYLGPAGFQYIVTDGTFTDIGAVTIDVRDMYFFSVTAPGTVQSSDGSSLSFSDADIIRLSLQAGGQYTYDMYFQGSNVGLTTANEDIDAFAMLPDGTILISTVGSYNVPSPYGNLTGGGNNLLKFLPYSLGAATAGEWSLYLPGGNIGLAGASENIDAVAFLSDSALLLSTTGNFSVPGASGVDSDLVRYDGGWSMYFDGSDVGLTTAAEDIDGLFVEQDSAGDTQRVYLSTRGNFSVPSLAGSNNDVLLFLPTRLGPSTAGTYNLNLDGALFGLDAYDIDGIYRGLPANHDLYQAGGALGALGLLGHDGDPLDPPVPPLVPGGADGGADGAARPSAGSLSASSRQGASRGADYLDAAAAQARRRAAVDDLFASLASGNSEFAHGARPARRSAAADHDPGPDPAEDDAGWLWRLSS